MRAEIRRWVERIKDKRIPVDEVKMLCKWLVGLVHDDRMPDKAKEHCEYFLRHTAKVDPELWRKAGRYVKERVDSAIEKDCRRRA